MPDEDVSGKGQHGTADQVRDITEQINAGMTPNNPEIPKG